MQDYKLIIAILGSSLLTTIFTKVFDFVTKQKKTQQILLLTSIEALCDKMFRQGYRTQMQTLRLHEAKDQYKKLDGDGYADALVADALKLELKENPND